MAGGQVLTWRTLVVDDDPQMGRQVKERAEYVAEGAPYRLAIDSTERFEKALELLDSEVFDLLIMDVRLGQAKVTLMRRRVSVHLRKFKRGDSFPPSFTPDCRDL